VNNPGFLFPVAIEIDQGKMKSKLTVMQSGSVLFCCNASWSVLAPPNLLSESTSSMSFYSRVPYKEQLRGTAGWGQWCRTPCGRAENLPGEILIVGSLHFTTDSWHGWSRTRVVP